MITSENMFPISRMVAQIIVFLFFYLILSAKTIVSVCNVTTSNNLQCAYALLFCFANFGTDPRNSKPDYWFRLFPTTGIVINISANKTLQT